jgi:hypothetical protein
VTSESDDLEDFKQALIQAIAQHRHWARPDKDKVPV